MPKENHMRDCLQNRELSWMAFNERCLDQASDKAIPPLERLKFVEIYQSNLAEFFRVRIGSLTDLSLIKKGIRDSKTGMTPDEQITAVHALCRAQQPIYEQAYRSVVNRLRTEDIMRLEGRDLDDMQLAFARDYAESTIIPLLSPQVVNPHHPFPHLESGALYVVARLRPLNAQADPDDSQPSDAGKPVTLGIIPVPSTCARTVKLPGNGYTFMLVEHLIEMMLPQIFSMYSVRQTAIICVTRNADLDVLEGLDEEADFLHHMKKILRKRTRLAAVRLESSRELHPSVALFLQGRLGLTPAQCYVCSVPLNLGYVYGIPASLDTHTAQRLSSKPFKPAWPISLDKGESLFGQIRRKDVLLTYPYETMDVFLQFIREAINDPAVQSIKITLYRLAKNSRLAELLCEAAEAGKEVQLLFELRARFDEGNNIEWAERCERFGCKVSYGFRNHKVHSKLCLVTRKTGSGVEYLTQVGTGNYNEKTAQLYVDMCFFTANQDIGADAERFFHNADLEHLDDSYQHLVVAPLQIKQMIIAEADKQIALAREGKPCGLFFRTNSVTDLEIMTKLVEASCAGVPITMLVRGICCLLPGIEGLTENVRVVSVVGRLLEHSRVYVFGPLDDAHECKVCIASADLMTRNMDNRLEVACPIYDADLRREVIDQLGLYLSDNVKLRELRPDGTYTPLEYFQHYDAQGSELQGDQPLVDAQAVLIKAGGTRHVMEVPEEQPKESPKGFFAKLKALFSY